MSEPPSLPRNRREPPRPLFARAPFAIALGLVAGLGLLLLARIDDPAARAQAGVQIGINGVAERRARDLALPTVGWVLHVSWPAEANDPPPQALEVVLREERTGMRVRVDDRMQQSPGFATLTIPEELRLVQGLLAIEARLVDGRGRESRDWRRVRIRSWFGSPPIGAHQTVHLDFAADRDRDGVVDFERDLERLGLASPAEPATREALARRVAERALERVHRAYAGTDDPNRGGRPNDPVRVRFRLDPSDDRFVTRICVGGSDPIDPSSLGHVRFDLRNERKSSTECDGDPASGVFPSAFVVYEEEPLYREVFDPFTPARGGAPIGARAGDRARVARATAETTSGGQPARAGGDREGQIARAIRVLGDALGSVLAHETGHALGLVAPGKPATGLFGQDRDGAFAHNAIEASGAADAPREAWLMDPGRSLRFAQLAGVGDAGELRFRPLSHAYLRDRVVLIDGR